MDHSLKINWNSIVHNKMTQSGLIAYFKKQWLYRSSVLELVNG